MDSLRGILLSELIRAYQSLPEPSEPTYEEIVKLDESLDIATEIEHMIEVGEIVSEPKDKKTKSDKDKDLREP